MAMVPDSECRMPTLMVSSARAERGAARFRAAPKANALAPASNRRREMLENVRIEISLSSVMGDPWLCLSRRALERRARVHVARHMPGLAAELKELISF